MMNLEIGDWQLRCLRVVVIMRTRLRRERRLKNGKGSMKNLDGVGCGKEKEKCMATEFQSKTVEN